MLKNSTELVRTLHLLDAQMMYLSEQVKIQTTLQK